MATADRRNRFLHEANGTVKSGTQVFNAITRSRLNYMYDLQSIQLAMS